MSFVPRAQEIYKHFKGNLYQIVGIAEHTETGETLVVYQALYGEFKLYARPLDMFVSRVDKSKYPEAQQEFRFELQGPEGERQRRESSGQEASPCGEAGPETSLREGEASSREESQGEAPSREESQGEAPSRGELREEAPQPQLDPLLLEFLDADTYEERLNILAGLHHRITQEMITTMAIACDVEVEEGDLEERYEALKTCLVTLERYECNRLR